MQQQLAPEDEQPFIKPWMVDMADAHYPVDTTKARLNLDWHPKHTLSQTLPELGRSNVTPKDRGAGDTDPHTKMLVPPLPIDEARQVELVKGPNVASIPAELPFSCPPSTVAQASRCAAPGRTD